jgi:sugar/nucleoside kinase (ribokinase family)
MPTSREQVCKTVAGKLSAKVNEIASIKTVVGFDGFVDEIIAVVDKRHDFEKYDPIRNIKMLGEKIVAAAGQSSNYELVVKQMKLGGNGPIMANALASHGLAVTYIGGLGYPNIHPVFQDFAKHAKVISIAEAGHTDALEFDDGKLMFGKITTMNDVNWDNLVARVGLDALKKYLADAKLIAMVNWTMLPHMSDIWEKFQELGFPNRQGQEGGRTFFVDLADPEKRNPADIRDALKLLTTFQKQIDVVLGLNLKESGEVLDVLGLHVPADLEADLEKVAADIRKALNLSCVVVHPRRGAAAATAATTAKFAGPFVQQPMISTGAGDHFNAGFCLGRVLGFELEECLCTGVATSGYYVRSAKSPTGQELSDFIAKLPPPQ